MKTFLDNRLAVLGLSIACILALGYVDSKTALEFDLFLFYAFPVAVGAWYVGRSAAVGLAALAVVAWFFADVRGADPFSSSFYVAWNTALRFGWILIVALTVSQLRAGLRREQTLNAQLAEALRTVKHLHGLLPICAWCKKIRNDEGYWEQVDDYLRKHTEVILTHGICPVCSSRVMRSMDDPQ